MNYITLKQKHCTKKNIAALLKHRQQKQCENKQSLNVDLN